MTVNVTSLLLRPDPPFKLPGFVNGEEARKGACSLMDKAVEESVRCLDNVHPAFWGLSVLRALCICHTNVIPSVTYPSTQHFSEGEQCCCFLYAKKKPRQEEAR